MKKRILFVLSVLLLFSAGAPVYAKQPKLIEVFDVEKGAVIKKIGVSEDVLVQAKQILAHLSFHGRFKLSFHKGVMVKIPIQAHVKNKWFDGDILEMIVILEPKQSPLVLLFNAQDQPVLFTTAYNAAALTKTIGLNE